MAVEAKRAADHRHHDHHHHDHGHGGHDHGHAGWVRPRPVFQRPQTFWQKVKDFLWGFFLFDFYHDLMHERAKYNDVMTLILYGELIGIPLMNSTIGLRLLPYVLPELPGWKHRQLEEACPVEHSPHLH